MKPLHEIGLSTHTDKANLHDYCRIYDDLFAPLRESPIRLLEIGILNGDSLRMWSQYFTHPKAQIVGADLNDRNFQDNDHRISTIYGDSGNPEFLKSIVGPWDAVIDDGGHFASQQMASFIYLWPQIAPGGYWICEDVHIVHSHQHRDAHCDILDFFNRIAHEMQDTRGAEGCAAYDPNAQHADIESVTIRRGLVIVRKRA